MQNDTLNSATELVTENFISTLFSKFYKHTEFAVKFGDYKKILTAYTSTNAPFAKVALAGLNQSFLKVGKELVDFLKSCGLKPITFVYSSPLKETIENVAGFFEFPEDTRLIIITDACLLPFARYYATVKDIPLVYLATEPDFSGVFNNFVFINTNEKLECISVKKNTFTIIDFNILNGELSECFQKTFSKFISVFDYCIEKSVCFKKPNAKLLSVYKNLFKSFNFSDLSPLNVISFCLKMEAVISLFGEINNFGADVFCQRLIVKPLKGFNLALSFTLAKIYALFGLSPKYELKIEDYNKRAEKISKALLINYSDILSNLNSQVEQINLNRQGAISCFLNFAQSYKEFSEIEQNIINAYVKLGGKPDFEAKNRPNIKKCIGALGDTPYSLGAVAVLREFGAL